MLSIRSILHPTDFSEHSAFAFDVACSLARDYRAHLLVLHVRPPGAAYDGERAVLSPESPALYEHLHERLWQLQPSDRTVQVDRLVQVGMPAAEIGRLAQKVRSDLIVMGTHGRTGLGRLVMGSVAEQVVRQAPCPVLTVRAPFREAAAVSGSLPERASAGEHAGMGSR